MLYYNNKFQKWIPENKHKTIFIKLTIIYGDVSNKTEYNEQYVQDLPRYFLREKLFIFESKDK